MSRAPGIPRSRVDAVLSEKGMDLRRSHLKTSVKAACSRPAADLETLRIWAGGGTEDRSAVRRAGAVLAILGGVTAKEAGRMIGTSSKSVSGWVRSFAEQGPEGITFSLSSRSTAGQLRAAQGVAELLTGPPPYGRDRWYVTTLARELGISEGMVRRSLDWWGISLGKHPRPEARAGIPGRANPGQDRGHSRT
jgi:transposase